MPLIITFGNVLNISSWPQCMLRLQKEFCEEGFYKRQHKITDCGFFVVQQNINMLQYTGSTFCGVFIPSANNTDRQNS